FILLTEREGMRLYPAGSDRWRRVLFPVVGSLGIGYLLFRYFPYARGSGVPQTKAALFAREGRITLRTVLGKFFCTSATLASGIPLGREGPSVQVGAGIASVLGRFLGLRPEKVKALLPVGAAAAIAAAFNTPLAAVLFSLEEIVGDLHAPVLGSVVLASATSWIVLRLLLGNNPLFKVPQYQLVNPLEFAIYAVLGVGRRPGLRELHEAAAGHAGALPAFPPKDSLVPTGSGRFASGPDGMVCAAGPGRGVWVRRRCLEWTDGTEPDGPVVGAEAFRRHHKLCIGQCGRYFRPCTVYRRHAGRCGGDRGASFASRLHCDARRLR